VAWRFQTRFRNWTKEAKLPRGKSFATLTINELPKPMQPTLIALRDNTQWALQSDNVFLIGSSGVGKSHIAAALGLHLREMSCNLLFYNMYNWSGREDLNLRPPAPHAVGRFLSCCYY